MISEIKSAIVYKLKDLFPKCKRYTDDVPQRFNTPAFVVFAIDQDYSKRLNNKYNGRISFDVAYFSDKPTPAIKSDCFTVQEKLLQGFETVGRFRVLNKNVQITDNVLHFIFDINYSEIKEESSILMQKQTSEFSIKKG